MTNEQKIEQAIKDVKEVYEKAKTLTFINDPVTYALYYVWNKYDAMPVENLRKK